MDTSSGRLVEAAPHGDHRNLDFLCAPWQRKELRMLSSLVRPACNCSRNQWWMPPAQPCNGAIR